MSERFCACGTAIASVSNLDDCPRCYQRAYRKRYYHETVKRLPEKLARHREQAREGMERHLSDPDKRAAFNAKRRKGGA